MCIKNYHDFQISDSIWAAPDLLKAEIESLGRDENWILFRVDPARLYIPKSSAVPRLTTLITFYSNAAKTFNEFVLKYNEETDHDEFVQICEAIQQVNGSVLFTFNKVPMQDDQFIIEAVFKCKIKQLM